MTVHAPLHFPPMATGRPGHVVISDAFSAAELERIDALCAGLPLSHEVVGPAGGVEHDRRDVHTAELPNGRDSSTLYLKLMQLLSITNMTLRISVWGICEAVRYCVYRQGRHCWHVDSAMPLDGVPRSPRKLSFEIGLSTPEQYEGGQREFLHAEKESLRLERGQIIVWPSYVLTRVDHVTGGVRRSLEGWVTGPEFV